MPLTMIIGNLLHRVFGNIDDLDVCADMVPTCPRCGCCQMIWEECENCGGEGMSHHDCGEDTCVCLDPENNVPCDVCEGEGGRWLCTCDENGKHHHGGR